MAAFGQADSVNESTLFLDSPTEAEASEGEGTPASTELGPAIGFGDIVRMIVVLGGVLGAIYGVFYLLRRATRGGSGDSPLIEIIGSQQLPGGKSLHLVGVGAQLYLVGGADGGVNLVAEIDDQESIDEIRLRASETTTQPKQTFAEALASIMPSLGMGAKGATKTVLQQQRDRLRRLG